MRRREPQPRAQGGDPLGRKDTTHHLTRSKLKVKTCVLKVRFGKDQLDKYWMIRQITKGDGTCCGPGATAQVAAQVLNLRATAHVAAQGATAQVAAQKPNQGKVDSR